MKNTFYILISWILLGGCVDPYRPDIVDQLDNLLVVDGTISGTDQTVIRLCKSIGVNDSTEYQPILNAEVWVLCDNGTRSSQGIASKNGYYSIQMEELNPSCKYCLYISLEGKEYQSTYQSPLFTPRIDTLYWESPVGEPVSIYVDTHDEREQSSYYRWSFVEDWETKAHIWASFRYDPETKQTIYIDLDSPLNHFYCWTNQQSQNLLLESTNQLSINQIKRKKLTSIELSDDRLSEVYRIRLKQYLVHKEGYTFYSNLQKNIELSGDIFAPQLSEMKGNIICLTDPDLPVLGYVDVATYQEKELYVFSDEVRYDPPKSSCIVESFNVGETPESIYNAGWGLVVYSSVAPTTSTKAPLRCVDCEARGGTKERPENWPTNHY